MRKVKNWDHSESPEIADNTSAAVALLDVEELEGDLQGYVLPEDDEPFVIAEEMVEIDTDDDPGMDGMVNISTHEDEWKSTVRGEGKKNKREKRKKKPKSKGKSDMIVLEGAVPISDDFVILEETGKRGRKILKGVKLALLCILFLVMIFLTYFLLSYRMVPEEVKGTNQDLFGFSVISRDYVVSLDEIREGDILVQSSTPDWFPLLVKYKLYRYRSHNGGIIFVVNSEGLNERIQQGDVSYILRGQPRGH